MTQFTTCQPNAYWYNTLSFTTSYSFMGSNKVPPLSLSFFLRDVIFFPFLNESELVCAGIANGKSPMTSELDRWRPEERWSMLVECWAFFSERPPSSGMDTLSNFLEVNQSWSIKFRMVMRLRGFGSNMRLIRFRAARDTCFKLREFNLPFLMFLITSKSLLAWNGVSPDNI